MEVNSLPSSELRVKVAEKLGTHYVGFDEMVWPSHSRESRELEWLMRYGSEREVMENRFIVASVIAAYHALLEKTNKQRNKIANRIKAASDASRS